MKRILVTGGPVYAYLDAVKIISNRFRGGLMAELASNLRLYTTIKAQSSSRLIDTEVIYLTCRSAKHPHPSVKVVYHDGFEDYMAKVKELAPQVDAVVHGAAVANLIPWDPIQGKFPSHNYKVGEPIPLLFKIAPRVIDEVKKVAPKVHLFGFKLLSGVDHDELIRAAYQVLRGSKATAVFANDAKDLKQKYAVTKERGVHPMKFEDMAQWIHEIIDDEYYRTVYVKKCPAPLEEDLKRFRETIEKSRHNFFTTEDGYIFGTVAIRMKKGFLTTGRGKKEWLKDGKPNSELDQWTWVRKVDHEKRTVHVPISKATLNAPLLDQIFSRFPEVETIIHFHEINDVYPTLPYAPPGTVRDSQREITGSFNIEGHGCFILVDKNERVVK